MKCSRSAFTLVELVMAIAVTALLASLILVIAPRMKRQSQQAVSLNNLHQIGIALNLYSNDHDYNLPNRVKMGERWPGLLLNYLDGNAKIYAEPGSTKNYITLNEDPGSNVQNNTSYVMNGFNDLGTLQDDGRVVKILSVEQPSQTILLAVQDYNPDNFYLDIELGEHTSTLHLDKYDGGSNYLFADGSSRFLKKSDYDHRMWLGNKSYQIP